MEQKSITITPPFPVGEKRDFVVGEKECVLELRLDVFGDSGPEVIRVVDASGTLQVEHTAPGELTVRRLPEQG